MQYRIVLWLVVAVLVAAQACTNTPKQPAVVPMTSSKIEIVKRQCVNNEQCAQFRVEYLRFDGGDSVTTRAVNNSIQSFILSTVGGTESLPFEVAVDSAGIRFCAAFEQAKLANPAINQIWDFLLSVRVLYQSPKVLTVELSGYSVTDGPHPSFFTNLVSYNLPQNAPVIPLQHIIIDTASLKSMLTAQFNLAKGRPANADVRELLYEGAQELTLPQNACILQEGIRFYYNDMEVAPHDLGPTDITLTWQQLGNLADKTKWL